MFPVNLLTKSTLQVSFDNVGGLDKHIRSLKEMILFPLMYPEVFQRFKISPPRGVLFYGQPGNIKWLILEAFFISQMTCFRKLM